MNGKLLANAFPINKVEVFFDNEDHSHFLGFTWKRVGAGRVPVGINAADSDFDTIGKTGGSKELQAHNHLIVDNAEKYVMYYRGDGSGNINASVGGNQLLGGSNAEYTGTAGTGNSGNLQPYIVMAFWKRIA